eukprot:GSChrysophyteH1.ASY1.ANO1.2883.1 assembled CDS
MGPKKGAKPAKGGKADKPAKADKKEKEEKPDEEKKDVGADPASVDFEAGLLFNRADKAHTGVLTADDFRQLWRDAKAGGIPGAPHQPGNPGAGAGAFEAGKIFSNFDADADGRLDKKEFEKLISTHPELMRQIPGLAAAQASQHVLSASQPGAGSLPTEVVSGRMLTHYDETAGVAIPRSAIEQHRKLGNTVTPLLESYRARYDRLRSQLTSRLLPKREHLLQLRRQLQNTSAEVEAQKKSIERETLTDGEQIIDRLRQVESMRQSAIKQQVLSVESSLESIERVVRRVEQANDDGLYHGATGVLLTSTAPGQTPVETVRAPKAASMVELIQQFADLSNTIETLSNKTVSVQIDFPTDDFPRETKERLDVLARCDKYMHALSVKDHMLWEALQEKEKLEDQLAEERRLSHEYAKEVASWAEMAQTLSQQSMAIKQDKEKLERRNRDLVAKLRENNIFYDVQQ